MKLQPARVLLTLCLGVGCARSSSPESSAPGEAAPEGRAEVEGEADEVLREYEGSFAQELVECHLTDENCLIRVQAIRHHTANMAKLDEVLRALEQDRREQQEQHEQTLRTMKRLAGVDPNAGMGFRCATSQAEGESLIECHRTWDECADRILLRESEGLEVEGRRCEDYAQAACFHVTRTLKEGERVMCYGDVAHCEFIRKNLKGEGFVSAPTECRVTD
ncbi:MAG: hypothetical protein AAF799_14970 [Myxococcota bacterium]